jgi:predicted nucleic acid-binding protein
MARLVCDASVLFKTLVVEIESHLADAVVSSSQIIVPELAVAETCNAIWAQVHRGALSATEAQELLDYLLTMSLELHPVRQDMKRALAIAVALDHPIYDCVYLALAERLGVPVVTTDARLLRVVQRHPVPSIEVKSLADFA